MEKFNLDKKESNLTTSPEPVPTPKIKPQEKNETENFISEKIDLWNKLIVDNPVLSIEEKGDALERVRMFSKVVLDNKALYDKYKSIPGGEKILIQKIFDTAETPK